MSVIQDAGTYPCEGPDCADDVVAGTSYCSRRCKLRDQGVNLLDNVRDDHRLCTACFRWTKEIERPPKTAPDCVVGFQYLTPEAELGQRESAGREDRSPYRQPWLDEEREATAPADRQVIAGTVCACGTTDHRDDYLRDARIVAVRPAAERLASVLVALGREGQHDKVVDAAELARTLRESAEAEGRLDWAWAVGRAVA